MRRPGTARPALNLTRGSTNRPAPSFFTVWYCGGAGAGAAVAANCRRRDHHHGRPCRQRHDGAFSSVLARQHFRNLRS
jgi:hypothetical protein